MTEEMQSNYEFLQSSLMKAGFSDFYNEKLKADMAAGKSVVDLPVAEHSLGGKDSILFRPQISEMENRPGFYIFTGIHAGLYEQDKLVASVTAPHFKMTGMTAAHIASVLTGGVVLHTEGQDRDGKVKQYFSGIDFTKPVKEGQDHELIRLPAKSFDLAKLASKEKYIGRDEEKAKVLADLQSGLRTEVSLLKKEGNRYPSVYLQLAMVENKEKGYDLALKVLDQEGTMLRVHPQNPKEVVEQKNTFKLQASQKQEVLPKASLQIAADANKAEKRGLGTRFWSRR
jgi:hypothetical protein